MENRVQTIIRKALETALLVSRRVVVSYDIAPRESSVGGMDLEVWDVRHLESLAGELARVVPGVEATAHAQTESGTCQEIAVNLECGHPAPSRRELQEAVEAIAMDIQDRLEREHRGLLMTATMVGPLQVSIEVSK